MLSPLRIFPFPLPGAFLPSSFGSIPPAQLILSAGADGALCVLDPSCSDPASTPAYKPASPQGYTSFTNARWADSQMIVSVGKWRGGRQRRPWTS